MATYAVCGCVLREGKVIVDRLVSAPVSINLRELYQNVMSDVPGTSDDQFTGLEIAVGEKRNGPWSTVSPTETVAAIADLQFRYVNFKIQPDIPPTATTATSTDKPDAIQVLMETARSTRLPSKQDVSNKKQKMFNDIIDLLEDQGLGFPGATAETEGRYIVQDDTGILKMTSRKSWSSFFKDDAKLSSSAKSDLAKDNFKAENVFKRQHKTDTTDVTSAQRKRRSGRGHVASNFWQLDKTFGDKEPGKLISGSSIAVCPNQDIAVVDLSAKRIKVYSKSGEYQHSFLTNKGPNAVTEQCYPRQVAVNALGMFFVTDETPWIKMFNSHGDFVHDFSVVVPQCKTPAHTDSLCPIGLALDVNGVLFIGEVNNKYVCRQQSDGTFIDNFKVSIEPVALAVTSTGEVIICACHMDTDVQLVDSSGQLLQTFNSDLLYTLRSSVERLMERKSTRWYPTGVFYRNGVIYISNYEIYCFSIVPDKGTLAACVTKDVTTPVGLTVTEDDKEFKLLVVDENGSCVKVFNIDK